MTLTFARTRQATQLVTPLTSTSNAARNNVQNLRAFHSDLGTLMAMLEVDVITLTECSVSRNWQLSFPASETAGIHYNLEGIGQMCVGTGPAIPLTPHTLVITPPKQPFRIDAANGRGATSRTGVQQAQWKSGDVSGTAKRISAGSSDPEVIMICGCFHASYGSSIDLFATLASPIVERFDATDQLGYRLEAALAELVDRQVGMEAMATALLKQVLITLLRRSLSSGDLRLEQFSILSDPQVTRAFARMAANPGAPHSVTTLSETAGLSRSAFMARFTGAVGCSPMVALRQLRMRQASNLLTANVLSIEQIAHAVGYASRSSFSRVFRRAFGNDPADYRALAVLSAPNDAGAGRGPAR
ncbi:helix-turn-helix domain-containing protein [Reyranella soli]|nr:AraC family transcriptional regulator [Reyranella soli]